VAMLKNRGFLLCVFLGIFSVNIFMSRALGKEPVPVRLDIHLTGGLAKPWAFPGELFDYAYVFDFDAKALVDKQKVKNRIPGQYRNLVGDELYVGYLFIPRMFALAVNPNGSGWAFYVDWSPIGLTLYKTPSQRTYSAPRSCQVSLNALLAYQLLEHDGNYFHSPRPGLGLRADFRMMVVPSISLKFSAMQNVYWPDYRTVDGKKRDLLPHYSAVCAGIILHIPYQFKI
jgi:hypothetical protein